MMSEHQVYKFLLLCFAELGGNWFEKNKSRCEVMFFSIHFQCIMGNRCIRGVIKLWFNLGKLFTKWF